jgi:ketosteroid isomerase-like protein
MKWEPILAATATMGDLGYSTGPWSLTKSGEKEPDRFGHFVSIWRWENGAWKLIFDLRLTTPPPTGPAPELQLAENHAPHIPAAEALPVMLARDRLYLADPAGQLPECAEENVRFYRSGKLPIIGPAAAAAVVPKGPGPLQFSEPKSGISKGGDLGYLWGEYTIGDRPSPGGTYLRIWRRNRAGEWNLALDLLHPR